MNRETRGLWLGFIGVVLFSATLPMTKLATGPFDAPQLSPVFVTFGRAALAGILSIFYLAFSRSPIPKKGQWGALFFTGLCVIIGFPLFMAMGLRHVESVHASVIMGILPLATAAIGSLWLGQRPSVGFWACAVAGSALVMVFVLLHASPASSQEAGMGANWADLLLLLAVLSASCGYVSGAQLTPSLRVSQVQLVQPFLSMLFSVPLLGESLDVVTVGFALAVIATVFIGKRMPVAQGAPA